jgi:hypothetical protein
MWKAATLDYTMNSARAAAFHLGDTLSTLLPVDAVLEIRRTSVLREHGAGQSVARPGYQSTISKSQQACPLPGMQFGGKCPLFQSIYYCF